MLPVLTRAVHALWLDTEPQSTWALLEEQLLHSRIADLALVRLDVEALNDRVRGGWTRSLTLSELRALHSLRPDRATRTRTAASKMRMRLSSAMPIFQRLVRDGYIMRGAAGLTRAAPVQPLVKRVVTVETKRDDPRRALQQTRGHRAWSHETYVAFDAAFAHRFERSELEYRRLGVGLIELSAESWERTLRARPHRANNLEVAFVGERALARLLGAPAAARPERRLPHGARLSVESEPVLVGPRRQEMADIVDHALRLSQRALSSRSADG